MVSTKTKSGKSPFFHNDYDEQCRCPNCHRQGMQIFYSIDQIPVHSCLLMSSQENALLFPTGNLRLGFCRACGFVGNTIFDSSVHNYSRQYEESQDFSPTFSAFAESLAKRLVEKYQLQNKTILEIGCGKGRFLEYLCAFGDNHGIGIDPSHVPARVDSNVASRVEFINDFYSEEYTHLQADFICCRHTLEHIDQTYDFMKIIRNSIGDRKDTLVFIEVPDVLRVLQEGAFWDIYYEHCSYFSLGSLARLFRSLHFDILDLELDYDDQYLLITAKPVDAPTPSQFDQEKDLNLLTEAVDRFQRVCSERIQKWSEWIEDWNANRKRTVVWGSGSKAVAFLTTLGLKDAVEYVVDINPYRQGNYIPGSGQLIVPPSFLQSYQPDNVIIMNPIYEQEIRNDLEGMGLHPNLFPV
jgi:SAM-dependent methyltransferase